MGGDKVRLGLYLHWIKTELDNETACLELPFTIILLISFSVLAYLHLKQAAVFNVEGAVKFDIEENANFAWALNFGHKTVHDVNSLADFWSWFRIGFLPLMVQHSWGYSESLQSGYDMVKPENASDPFDSSELPSSWAISNEDETSLPVRDDYLHYNRLVGGIRLRQQRSASGWEFCKVPAGIPESKWRAWLGKPCLEINSEYELPPQISHAESFDDPVRVEWLMTATRSLTDLQKKVVDMEDGCSGLADKSTSSAGIIKGENDSDPDGNNAAEDNSDPDGNNTAEAGKCLCSTCSEGTGVLGPWLDEQTERIEISFVQYNFEYGLYSLVTVNFFFNRGGMIHKLTHVQSVWANSFNGSFWEVLLMVTCDLVWIFSLSYILVQEVKEIVRVIQSSKQKWYVSLQSDYLEPWNMVDWVSILVAYFVVTCWVMLYLAVGDTNGAFEKVAGVDLTTVSAATAREAYESKVEMFFDSMEHCVSVEALFRMSFMFYPMVVMLRLFKSFDAQPRLAVVTRTLVTATQDMVHFFIILFSCYFCLSVNAVLLFGKDDVAFSTFERAVISCFRVLFGDWDYEKMREVGLMLSALWFWGFMLLLFMLMLNILLAILMEAYGEVQACAEGDTLPKQISQMVRRYRETQRGDRVRLNDVWAAYFKTIGDEKDMIMHEPGPGFPEGTGGRQLIDAEEIREHVFEQLRLTMPMTQAKRGVSQAKRVEDDKNSTVYTLTNVYQDLERLNSLTRDNRDHIAKVADIMEVYDFDEEDLKTNQQVPDDPDDDFTEHRQLVAEAVKGAMGQLTTEISGILGREASTFERRQKQLEHSQQDMISCAKDACGNLSSLRDRTDEVVHALQHSALAKQRHEAAAASSGLAAVMRVVTGANSGGRT